jgi:hypothetical protein
VTTCAGLSTSTTFWGQISTRTDTHLNRYRPCTLAQHSASQAQSIDWYCLGFAFQCMPPASSSTALSRTLFAATLLWPSMLPKVSYYMCVASSPVNGQQQTTVCGTQHGWGCTSIAPSPCVGCVTRWRDKTYLILLPTHVRLSQKRLPYTCRFVYFVSLTP